MSSLSLGSDVAIVITSLFDNKKPVSA